MSTQIRIAKINTINGCSLELTRIYRMARRSEMPLDEAKALCWILKQLSGMISESDFEQRLEALENANQ